MFFAKPKVAGNYKIYQNRVFPIDLNDPIPFLIVCCYVLREVSKLLTL